LTFPWNLPIETIEMIVSFALTISGFMIGTASFLMGIYLREYDAFAPPKKLILTAYLIICLVVSAVLAIVLGSIVVVFSCQPSWLIIYLMVFLLLPVLPAVAIFYLLIKNFPKKGLSNG